MIPAHIPTSRRRWKLTGLARPRSTFHGPRKIATAVRNSAGYAVAMLMCEIRSRRTENNRQNTVVQASVVSARIRCVAILRCQYDELVFGGGMVEPFDIRRRRQFYDNHVLNSDFRRTNSVRIVQWRGRMLQPDGVSSAWRTAPQRLMKTGSVGSTLWRGVWS